MAPLRAPAGDVPRHRLTHNPYRATQAPLKTMTDYDMHDLMRDQLTAIYVDLTALGLMPEQYDQRLTAALKYLRDARALLDECRA